MTSIHRRNFLQVSLGGLALGQSLFAEQTTSSSNGIPVRPLGNTGEKVSIIGLGGWDIGNVKDKKLAISIMHEAIDEGVTFFDNCWDYHQGGSEEIMGKAISQSHRREKIFLMSKVCARDYQGAKKHLEDSLRRLKTDRLDLWQFHGLQWDDDTDLIFDQENGAVRAALEAKKEGKIRFIGFTGHKDPRYHLAMLAKDFQWDTILFPVNMLDATYRSFQKEVLPICTFRNIAILGIKGLGSQNGRIIRDLGVSAETARRYALSMPISTLICGIQSKENLRQDIAIARSFEPMSESELRDLALKFKSQAADGSIERYKTGNFGCDWHHNNLKS